MQCPGMAGEPARGMKIEDAAIRKMDDVLKQDGDGIKLCFRKIPGSSMELSLEQLDCKGAIAARAGERCSVP